MNRSTKIIANIFGGLILAVCLAFLGYIIFKNYNPERNLYTSESKNNAFTEISNEEPIQKNLVITEGDYDDPSTPIINDDTEYRKLMFGDYSHGQLVILTGTVQQILENNRVLVATQPSQPLDIYDLLQNGIQFSGRNIILNFKNTPRVLEDDVIVVKGRYFGTVKYETVLTKNTVKIPKIETDFYESGRFNEERVRHFFNGYRANIEKIKQEQEAAKLANHAANIVDAEESSAATGEQDKISENVVAPSAEIQQTRPVVIEEPNYIRPPRLEFTDSELEGQPRQIQLGFSITASGKVENVRILESTGLSNLDAKVIRAMEKAIFSPKRENGVGVVSESKQTFGFNLSEN